MLQQERLDGSVAVYKPNDSIYITISTQIDFDSIASLECEVGDVTITQINLREESKFILITIYLHQRVLFNDLVMFSTSWLL